MDSNGSVHPANDYESEFTVSTDDGLKDPPPPPPPVETAVRPRYAFSTIFLLRNFLSGYLLW